ncbi:MAG: winged helix-turn-helix domain-containing protein [Pseudomonadota bacterium]
MQYRFDDCLLDTARFALYRGKRKVDATPQVLKFLIFLVENRDRVVTRNELLEKLFGRRIVTDNALTVQVRAARKAVGDNSAAPKIIATVHGHGYQFIADVDTKALLSFAQPKGATVQKDLEEGSSLLLADRQPSIAILPFASITASDDEQIVARGLAHDITTRVACTKSLLVTARGSSFQYPSGLHDVAEVGLKLGVRYLCQGSVQIERGQIRVTVGLADTENRREVWTHQFDRKLTDFLAIQEEVAMIIVRSMDDAVRLNEISRVAALPESQLGAWSALHRGLDRMYAFRVDECDIAERFFRKSIDIDPKLSRPYAGLSFVNYERAYLNLDDRREHSLRLAFDHAKHAIDVDPLDPMGHWVEGRAHFLDGELDKANRSASRAANLNPSHANSQYLIGWIALQQGDRELCEERSSLACRLSPQDPLIYGMRGIRAMNMALAGRCDEAQELGLELLKNFDLHYQAYAYGAAVLGVSGNVEVAADCLRKVHAVNPKYTADDYFSIYAFQREDDIDRIRRAFTEAKRLIDSGM